MNGRLAGVVVGIALLANAGSASAVKVAVFGDARYIDMSAGGEFNNIKADLAAITGVTVTTFTDSTAAAWQAGVAGADVLVIPELEVADLVGSLDQDARNIVGQFVLSGHGLILANDVGINGLTFLNTIFGYALVSGGEPALPNTLNASAAGTAFAGGPDPVPYSDGTYEVTTASLPPGALPIYTHDANTAVFATTVGTTGRVVFLAHDWFATPTPPEWATVLGNAVTFTDAAAPFSKRVALFFDPAFVDTAQEALRLEDVLVSCGQNVTRFTGTSAAAWRSALLDADVAVVPEMQNASLIDSLGAAAQATIANFVLSGGGLITNDRSVRTAPFLNGVFGFSITNSASGPYDLQAGNAAGTAFAVGPPSLASLSAVDGFNTASLPLGALSIYEASSVTAVMAMRRGFGRIVHMGFDWFQILDRSPWSAVMNTAIRFASVGPPNLALTAPAVNVGAAANVSANITSFVGLTTGNVKFRAGGDASFQTQALAPGNPATATLPGTVATNKGIQAFLEISDGTRTGTVPPLAPEGGRFLNVPVNISGFPLASLPGGAYQLAGVPIQAASTSPEAVFDELGAYDIKKWRYGTFDGSAYHEPNSGAANAAPGQGFWILAKNATNVAVSGTSTSLAGPVNITLHEGFNQIADPFDFPVDFAAITRPPEVEANLFAFTGGGYAGGVATLQPGQGYWLKNDGPGNKVISIPARGAGVATAPPALMDLADGADWYLRVDAAAGRFADRGNLLGVRTGASEGKDGFDLSDAPPPLDGWVSVTSATSDAGALFADWRPTGTDGETWQLSFASDQAGQPFRIDLAAHGQWPSGFEVAAFEGNREVDLGPAQQIIGAVGSTTAPRTFTVAVGNADYLARLRTETNARVSAFALASPFPNPTSAGATIDLAVPTPVSDARVQLFDVQGRLVRTLLRGPLDQGVHRLAWDGRDERGALAATGVYFLKAQAGTFTATRKLVRMQ